MLTKWCLVKHMCVAMLDEYIGLAISFGWPGGITTAAMPFSPGKYTLYTCEDEGGEGERILSSMLSTLLLLDDDGDSEEEE